MEKGATAEQAESAFRSVAAAAGESADEILAAMTRAANGTIDGSQIMQKAVKGMIQGLSGDQMVHIMEAARTAAIVSGQDISQAYDTITDAIANKMPRSLLQYGLISREQSKLLNQAMAMGITEVDIYALAMENAAKQRSKMTAAENEHAEALQRWKAMFEEVKESLGKIIFWIMDNLIEPLVGVFEKVATAIASLFAKAGAAWSWMTSGFKGGFSAIREEFEKLDKYEAEQEAAIDKKRTAPAAKTATGTKPSSTGTGASKQLEDLVKGMAAVATFEDRLTNLDIAEKTREISHLEAAQQRLQIEQQIIDLLQKRYNAKGTDGKDLISDPNARAALLKQIDEAKKKMVEFNLSVRDLGTGFNAGLNEGFNKYMSEVTSTFQKGIKLAQDTAQAMEQAFSDFFFDAMTGKLKSLGDYIKSFLLSVARAIANIMAQQAAAGILSGLGFGSPAPAGGVAVSPYGPAPQLHSGGYIPRFHIGGLSSDERAAILQTGEYVVSRKGVAALDRINSGDAGNGGGVNVVVNVENNSSQPVDAKSSGTKFDGQKYIVGVVLTDIEQGGPIRHAISGLGGA
jgi:hypothetical protein